MDQTYIEYFSPGSLVPETSISKVSSRVAPTNIPARAYGFRFFDRQEVESNGETLYGEPKNHSGMTFIGKQYSIEEIKKKGLGSRTLISNLENYNAIAGVQTRHGNWQPLLKGDKVIPE